MMPSQPHVALVYGTRPQTIKASALLRAFEGRFRTTAIDTGQHYDFELNAVMYDQLGVRAADHFLGIGPASPTVQTARILEGLEAVLAADRVDAVAVVGDTTSTLAAALFAKHRRLLLCHVEAGLRSGRLAMLEEVNRRMTDSISDLLCTPCARATRALVGEAVPGRIVETGDVSRDILERFRSAAQEVALPVTLEGGPFALCTLHRAELTSESDLLLGVLSALDALPIPVVLPLHPRTRGLLPVGWSPSGALTLLPPLGYLELIRLAGAAQVIITDSGGLQREAYWLGVPCVTMRSETEWIETLDLGANRLCDPVSAVRELPEHVARARATSPSSWDREAYGDGRAAHSVSAALSECLDGAVEEA